MSGGGQFSREAVPRTPPSGVSFAQRANRGGPMITATVRYKLPAHIDYAACRAHFHKIAPGFRQAKGLISKHFIWNESGWAGGVYQWESLEDAKAFYSGPWAQGIVERY